MPLRNSEGQRLRIRMIPEFQRGTEAQRGLMTCHDSWQGWDVNSGLCHPVLPCPLYT